MNRSVIPEIVEIIERRFDRATADRFSALPRNDARANAIRTRVLVSQPSEPLLSVPQYSNVDNAVWMVVTERDPGARIFEPPDDKDDGGWTLSGGPWEAAQAAAADAAIAYVWPELLTPDERQIMVDRWEAVFGPPRGM